MSRDSLDNCFDTLADGTRRVILVRDLCRMLRRCERLKDSATAKRRQLAGAAIGRLSEAYERIELGSSHLAEAAMGLTHAQALGASLARGNPAMVEGAGFYEGLRLGHSGRLETVPAERLPGLFEEQLAAAIVVSIWGSGSAAGETAEPLMELPHHPKALRVCLGIACVQAAHFTASRPTRRALLRRGQYCLAHARSTSVEALVAAIADAADPWILTREMTVWEPGRSSDSAEPGEDVGSGRVTSIRRHKKTVFADLERDGTSVQIALPVTALASGGLERFGTGDHLTVRGRRLPSRSGEPTLFVDRVERLIEGDQAPCQSSGRLRAQASVLSGLRDRLGGTGFLEQATPVLDRVYEGGAAKPYGTWVNQRQGFSYLRVTSEIKLIQSLAAGMTRCYEIGSSFRNESRSGAAHDEFLMLEAYAQDMDLDALTDLTVELAGVGAFGPKWDGQRTTIRFDRAVAEVTGIEVEDVDGIHGVLTREVSEYASARPLQHALQILLDSVVAPAFPGAAVFTHPPMPSSPLIEGSGEEAARRWVYVDGVDCAEVARNETDVEALAAKLADQHRTDPFCVPRDYSAFLAAVASLPSAPTGLGMGVSRIVDLREGGGSTTHLL